METKTSLVLEGGGMRSAYTAGCLEWLMDQDIEFENIYAISAGTVYTSTFLKKDRYLNHEISCVIIPGKDVVGLKAFLREGRIVAYKYGFNEILDKRLNFKMDDINNSETKIHFGMYDLNKAETIFIDNKDVTIDHLKAACSLPIFSPIVNLPQGDFLDGGITKMIPIEKSIEDGNKKHLCIATKPVGYVRKPGNSFVINLMKFVYHKKCPKLAEDYSIRHINYAKQMNLIEELEKKDEALLIRPQISRKVSRFGGKPEVLDALYWDGYKDMEANKEKILKILSE